MSTIYIHFSIKKTSFNLKDPSTSSTQNHFGICTQKETHIIVKLIIHLLLRSESKRNQQNC